ncbi:unnamed protein product, partial [Nesidiocoris tenuis]
MGGIPTFNQGKCRGTLSIPISKSTSIILNKQFGAEMTFAWQAAVKTLFRDRSHSRTVGEMEAGKMETAFYQERNTRVPSVRQSILRQE